MASEGGRKRTGNVWEILARLGHRGPSDEICQAVFGRASAVGMELESLFDRLGATRDWPSPGTHEWKRLRTAALRAIVASLAREGRLDCICAGPTADAIAGTGTPAANDEDTAPLSGTKKAAAMLRRAGRNPEGWSRCVKRETPLSAIVRWASSNCPGVPEKSLGSLADEIRELAYRDADGHILGSVMLRALEAELEAGRDEGKWVLVVSEFEEAIGRLRSVFERLSLL
ncbi:MAG: hypothetical protein WBE26_17980 [Phycisphaerae bacterium]